MIMMMMTVTMNFDPFGTAERNELMENMKGRYKEMRQQSMEMRKTEKQISQRIEEVGSDYYYYYYYYCHPTITIIIIIIVILQ